MVKLLVGICALLYFFNEPMIPCMMFKQNSTEQITCLDATPDSSFGYIRHLLEKNPTVVIRLSGHAWAERDPKELSLKRAEHVRKKLIVSGIDSTRLEAVAYGDTEPLFSAKIIRGAPTAEERRKLESHNRRLTIQIIAFDYDPKLHKRVEQKEGKPATNKKEDEDD